MWQSKRIHASSLLQSAAVCALLAACGDDSAKKTDAGAGSDASTSDASTAHDASTAGDGATSQDASAGSDAGATNDSGSPDAGAPTCDATHAPVIPSLALQPVLPTGAAVTRLVYATQAPGSDAWYLVQQTGTIRVFENGALRAAPILDVSIETPVTKVDDERGLLGLAFPPDFATSQLFYVHVTPLASPTGSLLATNADEVREYKLVNGTGVLQKTLLKLPGSAVNHNGGTLVFGPDGFLYSGTGDGGGTCNSDQPDAPQDRTQLFGKIHRLDPRAAKPYGAAGNPYPDAPTVIHIGFRNPFRFSIDEVSRSLVIGDVGQDSYEELNIISLDTLGKNFGWAAYEGVEMTCSGRGLGTQKEWEHPVFIADRRDNNRCATQTFCDWKSVIGGAVYRGSAIPSLVGTVIFGDYQGRRMVALNHCGSTTSDFTVINKVCDPNAPTEACFENSDITALTAVVRDHAGELYLVADSKLLKIVPGT